MGCHFLLQQIFSTQGIKLTFPVSLALAGGFFTSESHAKLSNVFYIRTNTDINTYRNYTLLYLVNSAHNLSHWITCIPFHWRLTLTLAFWGRSVHNGRCTFQSYLCALFHFILDIFYVVSQSFQILSAFNSHHASLECRFFIL